MRYRVWVYSARSTTLVRRVEVTAASEDEALGRVMEGMAHHWPGVVFWPVLVMALPCIA